MPSGGISIQAATPYRIHSEKADISVLEKLSSHKAADIEKKIREASYRGELRCPDPECRNPILKYCHGEIREPYFAHRDMTECDYLEYEKSSGMFREIRRKLYEHFAGLNYPVTIEVKTLAHHYTPLLFTWENGRKTALECDSPL